MTSTEQETASHPPTGRDPDFIGADAAIQRAALAAREKAKQTGVGVIYMEDGKIIQEQIDKPE